MTCVMHHASCIICHVHCISYIVHNYVRHYESCIVHASCIMLERLMYCQCINLSKPAIDDSNPTLMIETNDDLIQSHGIARVSLEASNTVTWHHYLSALSLSHVTSIISNGISMSPTTVTGPNTVSSLIHWQR